MLNSHSALEGPRQKAPSRQRQATSHRVLHLLRLGLVILTCVHSGSARTSKSSLSGKVTNTGINGLEVRLKATETNPLSVYDGYSTHVLPDGSFRFEDIDAGRYVLVVDDVRFMPYEYGASGTAKEFAPIE